MENSTFKKSESITNIAKALGIFQSKVAAIGKDGENSHFRSKFATLENIIAGIKKPLEEAKLSYVQMPSGDNELVTVLMHETGEFMESTVKMAPKTNDPQGQGSAITYMRRYSLSAMLGLATGDDDDGNAATKPGKQGDNAATTKKPEVKIDTLFEKAKKNLTICEDKAKLADYRTKISASTKYNAEQKAELIAVIDAQIAKK